MEFLAIMTSIGSVCMFDSVQNKNAHLTTQSSFCYLYTFPRFTGVLEDFIVALLTMLNVLQYWFFQVLLISICHKVKLQQ